MATANKAAFLALAAIVVAVVAGVALLLAGGEEDSPSHPEDGRFKNSKLRFEFEYPPEWEDITDKIKFAVPDSTQVLEHVVVGNYEDETGLMNGAQISVVKLNKKVAADQLEAELQELDLTFQKQAQAVSGKLLPPEWVELGGLKARQYIIEFLFATDEAASAQTITFFGDRQYTVNCQGRFSSFDEKVLPGCEKILQTFRFK